MYPLRYHVVYLISQFIVNLSHCCSEVKSIEAYQFHLLLLNKFTCQRFYIQNIVKHNPASKTKAAFCNQNNIILKLHFFTTL